jgi:phosphatidate cytidylyltransferase
MSSELGARVITALFLAAGFLAVLFLLPPLASAVVFALVTTLAAWEWAGLMKAGQQARTMFAVLVLLSCLILWSRPADSFPVIWAIAALFWFGWAPFWLTTRHSVGPLGYLVGWVLLVPTWAALVDLHGRSPMLLLAVMALVWIADIAAYFTGRAFGKHKLAPAISPGKTWEGVAGAVVGVMIYGLWVADLLPATTHVAPVFMAGALLMLTALSIVGDLFESMIKRQANMKDSSQLLPGHGGILDRIDSQTSTLPVVALALLLVSP